jgi:hypothetical protein
MKTLCCRSIQYVGRLSLLTDINVQSSVPSLCALAVALVSIYIAQMAVRNVLVIGGVTALDLRESSESILGLPSSRALRMTVNRQSFRKDAA